MILKTKIKCSKCGGENRKSVSWKTKQLLYYECISCGYEETSYQRYRKSEENK